MNNSVNDELSQLLSAVDQAKTVVECGKVTNISGLAIEVSGLSLAIGKICKIFVDNTISIEAEVIGFTKEAIIVMPYDNMTGIAKGMLVIEVESGGMAPVGSQLLGRIVDALGKPLDGKGAITCETFIPLHPKPLNPLNRSRIAEPLDVGVRVINALITTCKGQRMGIFAESGIGKSVLLGMMTKFTNADIVVVGLIGERGREVKEFIEDIIGQEGLEKSIIVAAAADNSPLMKVAGAIYATTIAEYFRDQGKSVLLIVDSLTRFAQAGREIALSCGELPTAKGYTPTVFARLSQLVERSGTGALNAGTITAFYTVLIEGEELSDPVAEHVRSLIDGHLILTKALAEEGHFPAIEIQKSVSRLMHAVVSKEQQDLALLIKRVLNAYRKNIDMINIGMYQRGSDKLVDTAIKHWPLIRQYLVQDMNQRSNMQESLELLLELFNKLKE